MNKISNLLKSSRFLYNIYFYVMSFLLKVLGVFVGNDKQLILFNCFGGKKYDDSPKAIYEYMLKDPRFDSYKLVWALQNPEKCNIPGRASIVKSDSLKYFIIALRAKMWITNSSIERGLDFKKKKTICFNSWHGTAIKVMGIDINKDNKSFRSKINVRADIMLAQSQYDIDIFSHAFQIPLERFRLYGLPRNDILANYTDFDISKIKNKLNISNDKTILLYAPTFREFSKDSQNAVTLDVPMNLNYWQERLGDNFVILFRAHYEVAKHLNLNGYPMFLDMSTYPDLNELMIISDGLISDYSSIVFDYSIMHKPIFCFAYDYDQYMSNRGMYLNLKEELPCKIHSNENSLLDDIEVSYNNNFNNTKVIDFQNKYVTDFGKATVQSCNLIKEVMEK